MQPLIAGPRAHLAEIYGLATAEDLVREALSLSRGAHVRHGCDVLDFADRPTGERLRFVDGSVTNAYRASEPGGQSPAAAAVRGTGTLNLAGAVEINLAARQIRVWTEWLLRTGEWARWHKGVYYPLNPAGVSDDGIVRRHALQLADKSHLWASTRIPEAVYLPGTTVAVDFVKAGLAEVFGETRFAIASSAGTLVQPKLFEAGTSYLEMWSRVLEAVGLDQLTADEDGRPASQALSVLAGRGPALTYGPGQAKAHPVGSVEPLLPALPNVVRYSARQGPSLGNVIGNGLAERVNQSTGPASIDARGGLRVPAETISVDVDDQAALEAFADADCQRVFAGGGDRWTGSVALDPRFGDREVIARALPRLGPDGVFNVTSHTYPLLPITSEQAVTMPITAERRVVLS